MNYLHRIGMVAVLGLAMQTAHADSFATAKEKLASAGCLEISFRSLTYSSVFETVDTVDGHAQIAADGRYRIRLGTDEYLYDGASLYSYSKENNQVTIEKQGKGMESSEIQMLTRLDELYNSTVIVPNESYRLTKRDTAEGNMPNPVTLGLDANKEIITRLEYKNDAGDKTVITIAKQKTTADCADKTFTADYPKSVERIKL